MTPYGEHICKMINLAHIKILEYKARYKDSQYLHNKCSCAIVVKSKSFITEADTLCRLYINAF